jgi:hypothetical protein
MSFFLDKCKNSPNLLTTSDDLGNVYKFMILGRGEDAFFQKNDGSLFCSMDAVNRQLFVKSIKHWEESNKKFGNAEREDLARDIKSIYEAFYKKELELISG